MPVAARAQDAAVEERLNKLSAQIEDLIAAKDAQNKRIEDLARAVRDLQDQQSKPNASYASQDDLKRLADKLKEIDQNRIKDSELIAEKLDRLGKTLSVPPSKPLKPAPAAPSGDASASATPDKGYDYVIQSGDTLLAIAKAYNEKGIKVTTDQILKANPGLKERSLKVGQKIFIPAAQP